MAKFLNTQGLSEWIPRIIDETERELVIITPYMQLSDAIYNCLIKANKRGVETTLVYRENKLSEKDKSKLVAIDNLNLFHHPNVHSKCYYNENYLLIASMNLYEFSEKNNREMGVLLHKISLNEHGEKAAWGDNDDDSIFNDAIIEIRSIITSSELEKKSRETIEEGFEMEIIKTDKEKAEEYCKFLNKHFVHKKFEVIGSGSSYEVICINYFDKIDVILEGHRVVLNLKFENHHLSTLHNKFSTLYDEYMFNGFKFYWNDNGKNTAYFYRDSRDAIWDSDSKKERYDKIQEGIQNFVQLLKPLIVQK
jgi:hypothetical protein